LGRLLLKIFDLFLLVFRMIIVQGEVTLISPERELDLNDAIYSTQEKNKQQPKEYLDDVRSGKGRTDLKQLEKALSQI